MGNFLPILGTEMPDQLQQLNTWAEQEWNMPALNAAAGSREIPEMEGDQTESGTHLIPVSQTEEYGYPEYIHV